MSSAKKPIRLLVVKSTVYPDLLSVRLTNNGNHNHSSATDIRRALKEAGYNPGDIVQIIPVDNVKR